MTPVASRNPHLGPKWTLIPLRIPTGYAVRWNSLEARRIDADHVEVNDSEDLLWIEKLPPPDGRPYELDATSPWRKLVVDVGWYRTCFRIAVLDPDWSATAATFETTDLDVLVSTIESWLVTLTTGRIP